MKAVPGILPTLLEMICFFSTPTIDVEPKKLVAGDRIACDELAQKEGFEPSHGFLRLLP